MPSRPKKPYPKAQQNESKSVVDRRLQEQTVQKSTGTHRKAPNILVFETANRFGWNF
jgi:hypothetical protein